MNNLNNKILKAIREGLLNALEFSLDDFDDQDDNLYIKKKKKSIQDLINEDEEQRQLKFNRLVLKIISGEELSEIEIKNFILLNKLYLYTANNNNLKNLVINSIKFLGDAADLNWIDTSKVNDMSYLFDSSEFNGDISKWDVSNVKNMSFMFYYSKFNGDISKWDVSNVINVGMMFYNSNFNLNISNWDWTNVLFKASAFKENHFIKEEYKPFNYKETKEWKLEKFNKYVRLFILNDNLNNSFEGSIKNLIIEDFRLLAKTHHYMVKNEDFKILVKNTISILGNGCSLNWIDTSNVTDMSYIFKCSHFNGGISKWNTSNVTDMSYMFEASDFNGDISKWDVSNVINMSFMFYDSKFNGDISNWNVSSVKDMSGMFLDSYFCGIPLGQSMSKYNISKWDVSSVTNMAYMFKYSLFNGDISNWDVSNVINMSEMFFNSEFNGDISKWDTSNVEDMEYMFEHSKFNKDISGWDVSKVELKQDIFNLCPIKEEYKPKFKDNE